MTMQGSGFRRELERRAQRVQDELLAHVHEGRRLAVVRAPPGSGKTWLLLRGVARAWISGMRVAVATQTNSQADDVCRRLARDYPRTPVVRFASSRAPRQELGPSIVWETVTADLPPQACIVVATTAKWGLVKDVRPFDLLFVDEAWQMSWSDFMLLGQAAPRFVLIGDPGQIAPVVSIDVSRWETAPRPPHLPAPELILRDADSTWELPASRRLPSDAVDLVSPFYDFQFGAFAEPGTRAVLADRGGQRPEDRVIDLLRLGSVCALTLPTPDAGPPLEQDDELARAAAELACRLLYRKGRVRVDGGERPLDPADIGLCATHRVMNSALSLAVPDALRRAIKVDTPERWQGLERAVMIVVHPLSGVVRPSEFDLETGRLCVMASRHLSGLIVVSRDHLGETLAGCIPAATQAVGRPDITGRGLSNNVRFWSALEERERVVLAA